MPAVSQVQQKFMGMCLTAKGRKRARGKCPPISVAEEFAHKPKGETLPKKVKKRQFKA